MKKYRVYKEKNDFVINDEVRNLTGSRTKRMAFMVKTKEKVIVKYNKYVNCTELASEKIAYEIAKKLGFDCARIELAEDMNGDQVILNYYFLKNDDIHNDAIFYLRKLGNDRKDYYTLNKILNFLKEENDKMIDDFLKIMVFDTLVGEQDRHEENWGISKDSKGNEQVSPIYDNGCCLLRDQYMNLDTLLNNSEKMQQYIKRSTTYIYNDECKRFKHFELIDELLKIFPDKMKKIIQKLTALTDNTITEIVEAVPNEYLSEKHKKCIIIFVKQRKEILLSKIEGD